MQYALGISKAKYLATSPASIDVASQAAKAVGIPPSRVFLLEGSLLGYQSVKDLVQAGQSYGAAGQTNSFKLPKDTINHQCCAFLSFSSGTTGLPEAVQIAHGNAIAQVLQLIPISPPNHKKSLAVLPLFHITGLVHILHLPILLNAEVIMLPSFTMESMLSAIVSYQIEEVLLVPPILIRLVRDPIVNKYDLSCVKRFSSGAAPSSEEIISLLQKKFPAAEGLKQGYGMTESCSCITAHPPWRINYKYARSVGSICASTEVRILKPDGTDGGVGEAGEILARGPQVTMGYLDNPTATGETFDKDGWLHTGDMGMVDGEGMLYVLDRIKELVKVKGIGVAPAELEDCLLSHEDVEDCAVMGIADEHSGEVPKAFVVLKSGVVKQQRREGEKLGDVGRRLVAFVKERKVRHKWIHEVEFVAEIPKSPSGKILRKVLKKMAAEGKGGVVIREEKARL